MENLRPIHADFQFFLDRKDAALIGLFQNLRNFLLELFPEANELVYHTHALTAVFSTSEKLSDAFCHIPIYTDHLNLGFNKGTLLNDPDQLLTGTGKWIRHIPVEKPTDFRNKQVKRLILQAIDYAIDDMNKPAKKKGQTISKIKVK